MTIPLESALSSVVELQIAEQDSVSDQLVYLSPALYDQLCAPGPASSGSTSHRETNLTVSLYPTSGHRLRNAPFPALIIHAQRDPVDSPALTVKASADVVRHLRAPGSSRPSNKPFEVAIRLVKPLSISTIYLAATSSHGFEAAQTQQENITRHLAGTILRQGDLLRLNLENVQLSLRVIMMEPLLQGVFHADSSQVLMTVEEDQDDVQSADRSSSFFISDSSVSAADGAEDGLSGLGTDAEEAEADADAEADDLLIDERFLAESVLEDFSQLDISINAPCPPTRALDGSRSRNSLSRLKSCVVCQLHDPAILEDAIVAWRAQTARQTSTSTPPITAGPEDLDEANVILATEKDMAAFSAFHGDWLAVSAPERSVVRVMRIMSSARLPTYDNTISALWMSPVLAQNILGDQVFARGHPNVYARILGTRAPDSQQDVSPIARSCPVPLPFADSLSIARVAGPLSVDRAYQGLFLEALRTYFEDRRRICRSGDIIAVAIEANKARFVNKELDQEPSTEATLQDIHDLKLPSMQASVKTATVYFKITQLKSELVPPDVPPASQHMDERLRVLTLQAQTGELGCVVDPDVTKMVQTGIEQCRVVDCDRWLGVISDTPEIPSPSPSPSPSLSALNTSTHPRGKRSSPLTCKTSPYATIRSLVDAILQDKARRFGLHLSVLLKGARGSGKVTIVRWVAKASGVQLVEINCFDLISDTDARTEGILRARFQKASECAPCILLLRNIEALARKSQALETGQEPPLATALQSCFDELWKVTSDAKRDDMLKTTAMPVAVFGTTSDPDKCPTGVLGCFKHEVAIGAPNEAERREILDIALKGSALSPDVDVKNLATQTAALVAADLVDLVSRARFASVARVRKAISAAAVAVPDLDLMLAGMVLTGGDFEEALAKARSSYSEAIGAPKIPNVTWDDVGGLASVKADILDTIQLPLEHPELFSDGLKKRSGILLYGPPGTGKTLLAKAVATSCSLNFFSVKGPELLNMYIGESEANVRRVFQRARDAKPCVIFFDELDSVAPKRGNQGDSGGVMDRIVSQLLAELDGMAGSSEGGDVFVIGATNRPDLLDPALLRPGRFDRMLYLSVSETHAAQLTILQALTRKFKLDQDVGDLSCIANQCPFNLTGADFYALCSDAMLKAMTRKASEVDERISQINQTPGPKQHPHPLTAQYYLAELATPDEIEVKVNRRDFELALKELTPSVSEQEMQHYREVQAKFSSPKSQQDEPAMPQVQANHVNERASMQEKARKAIEELGYTLQPAEERTRSQHGQSLSPDGLPQPIRNNTDQAALSQSELRETPSSPAYMNGRAKHDGNIHANSSAADEEAELGRARARAKAKSNGKGKGKDKGQGQGRAVD